MDVFPRRDGHPQQRPAHGAEELPSRPGDGRSRLHRIRARAPIAAGRPRGDSVRHISSFRVSPLLFHAYHPRLKLVKGDIRDKGPWQKPSQRRRRSRPLGCRGRISCATRTLSWPDPSMWMALWVLVSCLKPSSEDCVLFHGSCYGHRWSLLRGE
ncbi:hypothetical protein CDAR_319351 [Caerostris darwini]|uniref:Uncharacterized protein n=1 Tax=Caerostris darwini TaxID=1538125 RepID=A0AAV4TV98_9ARAC|nr:hypothetical protein CDAR_319351 [Caerostris darwini]